MYEQKSIKNNGIKTKVWGPHAWKAIHFTAIGYPLKPTKKHKSDYKNYFKYIALTLSCGLCRISFIRFLKTHPLDDKVMSSRRTLFNHTLVLHNLVNAKLGCKVLLKKDFPKMYKNYDQHRSKGCSPTALGCK
jgi:hypothetical protein